MRFIRRWCARILITAIVLLGTVVAIVYFGSERILLRYRPEIETALSSSIGAKISFGHVHLLLVPTIKLVVQDAVLDWKSPAEDLNVSASIPKINVSVAIKPLFDRKIAFRAFDLISPSIVMTKTIATLPAAPAQVSPEPTPVADPAEKTKAGGFWFTGGTSLPRIRVKDGSFSYSNDGKKWAAEDFNLSAHLVSQGGVTSVPEMDATFHLVQAPPGTVPVPVMIKMDANATISPDEITLDALSLTARPKILSSTAPPPLVINSPHFGYHPGSGIAEANGFAIRFLGTTLEANGEVNFTLGTGQGELTVRDLSTQTVNAINTIYPISIPISSGTMSGKLNVAITPDEKTLWGKGIELRGISTKSLKLDRLSLPELQIVLRSDTTSNATISLDAANFSLKTATNEQYGASAASGTLRAARDKKGAIRTTGDLSVDGFLYSDAAVEVSKVQAKLSRISGLMKPDGSIEITAPVDGRSVQVRTEMVQVLGIRSISGPITVSIPAKGGYAVKGPAALQGGGVIYEGHDFRDVSGTAQILITGPEKRFTISSLTATSSGENIKLGGEFSMVEDSYRFTNISGSLFDGSVVGRFIYPRRDQIDLTGNATAQNINIEKAYKYFAPGSKRKLDGTVKNFDITFKSKRGAIFSAAQGNGKLLATDGLMGEIGVDGALVSALRRIPIIGSQFDIAPAPNAESENGGFFVLRSNRSRALQFSFTIGGNAIRTSDLELTGQVGTVKATGSYNFDSGFRILGSVVFLEKTFRDLAGPLRPIGNLFGSLGKIEIPLTIGGKTDDIRVRFDPSRAMSMTAPTRIVGSTINEVGSVIGSVGNFVFGGPSPTATPGNQAPTQ